jgi:hypothetical protein
MLRRVLGIGVIAVSLAACSQAQVGHQGQRLDGAVRAWAVRVDTCGSVTAEHPMVCTSSLVKNLTDHLLFVSCSAEALDASGTHLFNLEVGPSGFLDPRQRWGGLRNTAGDVIDGVTLQQVRAVDRYDVACEAHRWIGPTPTDEYWGD